MPKAEESSKLLNAFSLDVAFGRVYAFTAPSILQYKRAAQFFINYRIVLFIMIGSHYQNLHFFK